MNTDNFNKIIIILLSIAIILTSAGGFLDIQERKEVPIITKEHAWNDGLFLVVFAIALILFFRI